ncbi:YadA C-terminal domain-containing protein [Vibrio sp. SCSIO 43133]|uniref:YadA C-terminal domain-containing protein n=1 Tax=Vibrio sp. SCSIO 43133 TaxID=2802577 RepID=UPI0020750CBE|nr:YadA C-terminal domain-containing protein [Vibrio sp. SCSIO 43133]USE03455.1 YadA C-terminal domain-containing protein [Vibrio sp. SCSIO 43133]
MKKTRIALTLVTLFSAGSFAAEPNFDQVSVSKSDVEHAAKYFSDNYTIDDKGNVSTATGRIEKIGSVSEVDGNIVFHNETTGEEITIVNGGEGDNINRRIDEIVYTDGNGHHTSAKVVDNDMKPTPLPPQPENDIIPMPDVEKAERDANRNATVNNQTDIARNQASIANNSARIDNLEQDMKAMGNKMLDLEDRMDGVVATSHAVTNARPMVQDAGEFAMGVGIGAAGSKQALALGGAYQFNANWSSSMTVNYETAGKRSNSQVSAGAGVQYRFK